MVLCNRFHTLGNFIEAHKGVQSFPPQALKYLKIIWKAVEVVESTGEFILTGGTKELLIEAIYWRDLRKRRNILGIWGISKAILRHQDIKIFTIIFWRVLMFPAITLFLSLKLKLSFKKVLSFIIRYWKSVICTSNPTYVITLFTKTTLFKTIRYLLS